MQNVIITGATGFVGIRLVKLLLKNNINVTAVVRRAEPLDIFSCKNLKTVVCDMKDIGRLHEIIVDRDFDTFYHLAWDGSSGDQRGAYGLQLENIKHACDAVSAAKYLGCKKFVVTGTISENIVDGILNRDNVSGTEMYAIAKQAAHVAVDVLCKVNKLPYVWAQLSNIYGENNTTQNIVSYTLNELQNGRTPKYTLASQFYDLVYIGDVVRGLFLLGECNTSSGKYFIGSGKPRILRDYLISISRIFGAQQDPYFGFRDEDGIKYDLSWFDTTLLERDTNFTIEHSFEHYIENCIINKNYN